MKQGALRLSAIALGAAAIALLMPVPPASAAVRHHGLAGSAIHRSAMHASYRAAWRGGHRYAHGWRGYGWRGVAVAGGYGGYYGADYYRHRHSCWWYRHYDPYDMPSWCGTYSYGYDYGDYGPYVGFAYGYGPGYYGATATLAGLASTAGIASMAARQAASRAPIWARLAGRISFPEWAAQMSPGWEPPTSPEASTAAWAAPTLAVAGSASTRVAGQRKVLGERVPRPPLSIGSRGPASGFARAAL